MTMATERKQEWARTKRTDLGEAAVHLLLEEETAETECGLGPGTRR